MTADARDRSGGDERDDSMSVTPGVAGARARAFCWCGVLQCSHQLKDTERSYTIGYGQIQAPARVRSASWAAAPPRQRAAPAVGRAWTSGGSPLPSAARGCPSAGARGRRGRRSEPPPLAPPPWAPWGRAAPPPGPVRRRAPRACWTEHHMRFLSAAAVHTSAACVAAKTVATPP